MHQFVSAALAIALLYFGAAHATQPAEASAMSYSNAYSQQQTDVRVGVGQAVSVGPVRATGGAGGDASATAAGGNAAGGSATASAGSATASAGSAQSAVTINSQAARAAYAPDILATPTAPCRVAVGASAGWLGGALGFGTSVLDEGCHIRETARVLAGLGLVQAAIRALCQDAVASKALGEACKD